MVSLGVHVIISSGINSLGDPVYKKTIAFSHHGHKAFTWWHGTPVAHTVYQEYITLSTHYHDTIHLKRTQGYDQYLPTIRTDKRTIVRLLRYAPNYANVACCVPRHEFRATHSILQPFITCWLLQNLTGCTLHPHMLGIAAVKKEYRWYVYKYFALISSTDGKCTVSHERWYWLSQHLSKCIIELTQALERDTM